MESPLEPSRNHGTQPLDAVMLEHCLGNHDLVAASAEPMTHKAVVRARKGRQLTAHMQRRMAAALNKAVALQGKTVEREWQVSDLFTYPEPRKPRPSRQQESNGTIPSTPNEQSTSLQ